MPPIDVAIWNCVMAQPTVNGVRRAPHWENRTLQKKVFDLEQAVQHVSHQFANVRALQGIFVAPEYAFGAPDQVGSTFPREPITTHQANWYYGRLAALSNLHPRLLIVPGTVVVKDGNLDVENRVVGYFGGASVFNDGKQNGVGEVPNYSRYRFRPGNGGAQVAVAGVSFFVQICRDATMHGPPDPQVDIHLCVGQGVGRGAINKRRPRRARVIADPVAFDVVTYNLIANTSAVLAAQTNAVHGIDVHTYTIP
jgi:hypothetical protein